MWSSLWPSRPEDEVHLELSGVAGETLLRFSLRTPGVPPEADQADHLRRRISRLLFADLRYSYGQ